MSPQEQSPPSPPGSPIRVLLVEDKPSEVVLVHQFLKDASAPVVIRHVGRLQHALSALKEDAFDVVILDLSLPDAHGLETLHRLLDTASKIVPPVLVMTGLDDEDVATKAVQAGAQDYLVKGAFEPTTLFRSLRYAIERSRLVRELKTSAEELARSEELLRQAAELSSLGHWAWDAVEERRIYCSEQQARIDDVPFEQYVERVSTADGYLSLVHPEDRDEVKKLFDALRMGEGFDAEYRHITSKGETRFVRSIAKPVLDETNTVIREYGTVQDITERKHLELERMRAEKMAALGVLASGIAHDFNNMLFAIIGLTESAANRLPEGGEARTCLEGALEAGEKAADLVRQILTFGRQDEVRLRVLDLHDAVASALPLVRASLPTTIEIHQSLNTACGPVMADPSHVHQILLNLASNAADAMQEKGGLLEVCLDQVNVDDQPRARSPQLAPGPYARLTVRDTGCGIDDRILGRIFDPFFTTKEMDAGTGMGLAAVHGIVSGYRGAIDVSSKWGCGSRFDIYLPIWVGEGGEDPRGDATGPRADAPAEADVVGPDGHSP